MYDNQLRQEIVEAEDAFHAAISYLGYEKQDTGATTLEELQDELWDSEEQINVIDIKPTPWKPKKFQPMSQIAVH
jgi:hypothetical protein